MTLAPTDFQLLANAGFPPAKFEPGEVIFSEGDKMYVIRSGEIEVERDGLPLTFLFLVHETPFFAIAVTRSLADRLRRSAP